MRIKLDAEYQWVFIEAPDGVRRIGIAWDDMQRDFKIQDYDTKKSIFLNKEVKKSKQT